MNFETHNNQCDSSKVMSMEIDVQNTDQNHNSCEESGSLANVTDADKNSQITSTPDKDWAVTPYNPFSVDFESLSFPTLSPSFFSTLRTPKSDKKTFNWSIEQIAVLHPVDIDESTQQDTWPELDEALEEKAQRAIERFFAQNKIVPSPLTASVKKVVFQPTPSPGLCLLNNVSPVCVKADKENEAKDVSTQTLLTIPCDVDLLKLLGPMFSYNDNQPSVFNTSDSRESLNTSSLRRKLFTAGEATSSDTSPIQLDKNVVINSTPSSRKVQMNNIATPGSICLESSPITPQRQRCSFLSNVTNHTMSTLSISPIGKSIFKTPSSGSHSDGVSLLPKTPSSNASPVLPLNCSTPSSKSPSYDKL